MRTDRAGSQASQGSQGGKSYPSENSQVMPMVIVIFLPLACLITDDHISRSDTIEKSTSIITFATLYCQTVNISTSDFCRLIFQFFARDFFVQDEALMGKPLTIN